MAKCLIKYAWVKLPRAALPEGKGLMGHWMRLASRAAFRKGVARYCGYENEVTPGMWSGGIVGLKIILGVKSRSKALAIMDTLSELGYLTYELDSSTKKLSYQISDWVVRCSGKECMSGAVYTTDGYGFLCLPRDITQRLYKHNYIFEEADAWLDLFCHSVWQDPRNAFSFLAPSVQYGEYGAALTLETLGQRWGWEKTKVWRFFKKYGDAFSLYRLPGSCGCLIFNKLYPTGAEVSLPNYNEIERIIARMRILAGKAHYAGTDNMRMNKLIVWYSRRIIDEEAEIDKDPGQKGRVAELPPIIRAYISHCWNCKNCIYDCGSISYLYRKSKENLRIRGPCALFDYLEEKLNEQSTNNRYAVSTG